MAASKSNPIYSAYIVTGSKKYNVTPLLQNIDISDREKEWACRVTIDLADVKGDGLAGIITDTSRIFLYADTGSGKKETFRGFVWGGNSSDSLTENTVQIKCYDNLIFMQESEESLFYTEGKATKTIFSDICSKWGISLYYGYQSITHSKLALRGRLSDVMTADVLDLVKDRTGKKYVILSKQDVMHISGVGSNATVYTFKAGQNAIQTRAAWTKDGMITKVVILGKADDNERQAVEATVAGNTSGYGTLQKVITRDSNTTLADAKTEANNIIKKNGKPTKEYELRAVDVPWIRKGDKVKVNAPNLPVSTFIVKSVDRSITNKSKDMTLTMEEA